MEGVAAGALQRVRPWWWDEVGQVVATEAYSPAGCLVVQDGVVMAAEQDQVVEAGAAAG